MTFTARDLRDQIVTATDASDGDYDIDAITEEIISKHGAVNIDALDTDEFWAIVGKHAKDDAPQITLPTPVLAYDTPDDDHHKVGHRKARSRVLDALSMIRETHQGIPIVPQQDQATEAFDYAESAFEERIKGETDAVQDAQRDRVQEATISILAGMVARLMADK